MADVFVVFMSKFKENLSNTFPNCNMDSWDVWIDLAGTGGWRDSLKDASDNYMHEVFELWNRLDWWASDYLDSWLIDCASYLGLCEKDEEETNNCTDCPWLNEGSYENE